MTEHDDHTRLTDALRRLGGESIEVDDARLDVIEARLMSTIGGTDEESSRGAVVAMADRRRRGSVRAIAIGAVAASLLAIAVLAGFFAAEDDGIVIAAADRVEVVLPDGETVDGRVGLALPDGASLDVTGFVEVEGVRYGPGSYRVVDSEILPVTEDPDGDGADVPADRDVEPPAGNVDAPPPAPAATTTTTVEARATTTTTRVRSDSSGGSSDQGPSSTTVRVIRDDGRDRDQPTTTTRPVSSDTRPISSTSEPERAPTTDAPTRTTTTEPQRDEPPLTRPATTTTAPRDRSTTTSAPTSTVPQDTTTAPSDRPRRRP